MHAPVETPSAGKLAKGFRLGTLRIDPQTGEVRGPVGREQLDPKVMHVLVMLAERAGQVVLREDLLARIWPNVVVTDEVLSRCIYELRRQLNLAAGGDEIRQFIETLPKRGYRLNGEIAPHSVDPSTSAPNSRPRAVMWAAAVLAAVVLAVVGYRLVRPPVAPGPAAELSIAVLPFVDMSEGQDQAYLSDGIAEEILNRLVQADKLRVISRTSSFAYRNRPFDVAQIADRLKVSHLLEGSVRKSGNRARITAQLIAASDSSHVWSDTYDRELDDLFAIQDEIAGAVATALETKLAPDARVSRSTSNVEAYEKFLQGTFLYYRRAPGDFKRSVRLYEEAVALDPRFAKAWASLASAYSMLASAEDPPSAALRSKEEQAARKAVELEPNLAMAHIALGQFYGATDQHEKAHEHYRRAATLDPDSTFVLQRNVEEAIERGDMAKAIEIQGRVVARDPLAAVIRINLAVYLLADGQLEKALSQFRQVQDIHPNTDPHVSIDIVHVLILQNRLDEAQAELHRVPEGNSRDQGLALLHAANGRKEEADAAIKRMVAETEDHMDTVRLAEVYAFRDMHESAFEVLDSKKSQFERDHGRDSGHVWYLQHESRLSPFLKKLHSDPRWAKFVAAAS